MQMLLCLDRGARLAGVSLTNHLHHTTTVKELSLLLGVSHDDCAPWGKLACAAVW